MNTTQPGRVLCGPALGTFKHSLFGISRWLHLAVAPSHLPKRIAIFLHAMPLNARESLVAGIEALQARGYRFCTADEFVKKKGDGWAYLSFDDNYNSWLETSHLLANRGVVATFYCNTIPYEPAATPQVVEAYYDRLGEKRDRTPLSKRELREIAELGHTIGCHTHRHPNLGALSLEEGEHEVLESKNILEDIIRQPVVHFSIPFGMLRHCTEELKKRLFHNGFRTIAYAIPGMLRENSPRGIIHRTMWRENRSLYHNMANLRLNCATMVNRFGRSPIG